MFHRRYWVVSFSRQAPFVSSCCRLVLISWRCLSRAVWSCFPLSSLFRISVSSCLVFSRVVSSCARLLSCCADPPSNGSYPTVVGEAKAARLIVGVLPGHLGACPAIAEVRPNQIDVGVRGCWQSTLFLNALHHRHHDQTKVTADACSQLFRFMLRPRSVIPLSLLNRPSR